MKSPEIISKPLIKLMASTTALLWKFISFFSSKAERKGKYYGLSFIRNDSARGILIGIHYLKLKTMNNYHS